MSISTIGYEEYTFVAVQNELRELPTSYDVVESINFRIRYPPTGIQRAQRRQSLYDSVRELVTCNFLCVHYETTMEIR